MFLKAALKLLLIFLEVIIFYRNQVMITAMIISDPSELSTRGAMKVNLQQEYCDGVNVLH